MPSANALLVQILYIASYLDRDNINRMASVQLEIDYAKNHVSVMLHRPINWLEELPGSWTFPAYEEAWP
ncbi:hypothetical protein HZ326_13901 [Fusarium oxysporum f. sp. albedinis]|nr:hypothetical protein HZ326_13901 [Fusarium oxysporum f. sp. albedinis]